MGWLKTPVRLFVWLVLFWVALLVLYAGAALWSAALPERQQSPQDQGHVLVALCHDVIHTDFAMPLVHVRAALPAIAASVPEGLPEDTRVLIGWGDYEFFTRITTLDEFDAAIASKALLGLNPAALRVQWTTPTYIADACTPLQISDDNRARLDRFIAASLNDRGPPLPKGRYGEVYLSAHGRYSPLHTCNQWASRALKEAGLPRARFAPFSFSILWPLEEHQ